jgi:hypothetical protein
MILLAAHVLAQTSRHLAPPGSLSLWRGAHVEIAHATLSSLCACQVALVVAQCSFELILRVRDPGEEIL